MDTFFGLDRPAKVEDLVLLSTFNDPVTLSIAEELLTEGGIPFLKKERGALPFVLNPLLLFLTLLISALLVGFEYTAAISVNPMLFATALCMMLGQIFPVFSHFKDGNTGILTLAATALLLCPLVFLILLICVGLILLATRYTALSFMIGALLFPLVLSGCYRVFVSANPNAIMILVTILMGLLVVMTLRGRISAIMRGEEPKFTLQRKPRS